MTGGSDTAWLKIRGLRLGLSYSEVCDLPLSELLELINADTVMRGLARVKPTEDEEAEDFFAQLERK